MPRRTTALRVRRTERLTPGTIRVVAGGPGLAGFPDTPHTDRYVEILFPRSGAAPAGSPDVDSDVDLDADLDLDLDQVRARLPRAQWPATRAYTVRALDRAAGELTVDVVHHGDTGLGGPWAAGARPGDVLRLLGPRGTYAPDPAADWHLFVGDESALPAIAAAVERVSAGVPALAVLEVAGPAEEQPLTGAGDLRALWLHRGGEQRGGRAAPVPVVDAVRALQLPAGRVHAFVHGEAGLVRAVRRHLVDERGVPREHLSVSAYWRFGRTADGRPPAGPAPGTAP